MAIRHAIQSSLTAMVALLLLSTPALAEVDTQIEVEPIDTTVNFAEIDPQHVVVLTDYDYQQIDCMAINTYYEARGEPVKGQIAVNNVVMNRVASRLFPNTPCDVVYQRNRRGCQFSWTCQRKYPIRREIYDRVYQVAKQVYINRTEHSDITSGAQYYHATYVRPSWSRVFNRTTKIGLHVFYKDPNDKQVDTDKIF